ncbi:MAG: hypothetical protein ABR955_14430 [Verrucomicrobiota bacterium]|jgi:hypothetical protein
MNNFAELSDGDGAKFLVRWRGRQEGPYLASVIEAKLAANEIGLLHEIFYEGKWVTIRDYTTERETILRAENQARQEQQRREREEAERQAKELENQRQSELLAEERRRTAHLESLQSKSQNEHPPIQPLPPADKGSSGLRTFGVLLLIGGLAVTGYFFFAYDTSVDTGDSSIGRVNNLGLMADRQNGIIIGIGLAVIGTIMLVIGSRGKN